MNILVIPDAHASPQSPNTRFEALGNFIVERKPEVIVCIGDLSDLSTLSSYDKNTKKAWNKTYARDVQVTVDAQEKLFAPIKRYNNTQGKKKKIGYHPRTIHTLGNHCAGRYEKFLSVNPEFEGMIGLHDLRYDDWWDTVVPYLHPYTYSGITFSHYFYLKSQRYPIGSPNIALRNFHVPLVWGHSHSFSYALDYNINGDRIAAVNVGCFLDPKDRGDTYDYTGGSGSIRWWNGVVMLNDVNEKGEFDLEQVSTERLFREYI